MGSDDNDLSVLGSETVIMVPRGNPGVTAPLKFEMSFISQTLNRTREVANVNVATLGPLITDFNMAMIQLNRLIGLVEHELRESENHLSLMESISLIERADKFLSQKGQKSSADTRKAAVATDPEVVEATRRRDSIQAISIYVRGLKEAVERAYYSAKLIIEMKAKDPYYSKLTGGE